jgi:class 3 adenylate cyclase/pimeloyl-ACP methyl ester carboxylesterase
VLAPPPLEFVRRDGLHLAYQRAGEGPFDLVFVAGALAISLRWEEPGPGRTLRRMASFGRLVTYDQRGMGYSDRMDLSSPPTIEDLVADLEAVVGAAGVRNPVLFGTHNGGAVAALYASRHRVRQLVLCNAWARLERCDDFPIGLPSQILDVMAERYRSEWGGGEISNFYATERIAGSRGKIELASTSHNQLDHLFHLNRTYDIRHALPMITAPTLVIHLEDNPSVSAEHGRYLATSIPGARLVLLPGADHNFLPNYGPPVIDEVERFTTGRISPFTDRLRTTMLFTDIVNSTPLAASMGDERWSVLMEDHNELMQQLVAAHGGHEVKNTGDGFLVAFDDTDSAVRCALAATAAVADLGLELRAGVHVGEVARMGKNDFSGIAVHFAQRLCARAEGGQLLTSADVRSGCDGAAITFEGRGLATFKGIPGEWDIFEAHL